MAKPVTVPTREVVLRHGPHAGERIDVPINLDEVTVGPPDARYRQDPELSDYFVYIEGSYDSS